MLFLSGFELYSRWVPLYLVYLEFSNPCQHFRLGRLTSNEKSLESIQF